MPKNRYLFNPDLDMRRLFETLNWMDDNLDHLQIDDMWAQRTLWEILYRLEPGLVVEPLKIEYEKKGRR